MSQSLEECLANAKAYANAYAYDYAYAYGNDLWLTKCAKLVLDVLIEMKSPGCEWLWLLEETK